MKKGVAPSRATLSGTDDFTTRIVSCLPHFIPPENSATGPLLGVAALKHRFQRLQRRALPREAPGPDETAAAPSAPLTLAEVEPLSVWRFWLDETQKDEVSDMIDKMLKGNSSLELGSFADNKKKKKGGAGTCADGSGAAASSFGGGEMDSGLFD